MSATARILIVDDDRAVTVWLTTLLRRFGYTALVAEDGIQAMAQTRLHRPELILLDWNMPAGNGEFVLESLKKHPDYAPIPVILMTGDPDVDPQLALRLGADACLSKTADAYALLHSIRSLLGRESEGIAPLEAAAAWA
jgi:DNA-binding response OmpR family regulator